MEPIEEALITAIGVYVATMAIAIRISHDIILAWGMVPTVAVVISSIMIAAALIARKGAQIITRDIVTTHRRLRQQH